MLKNIYHIILLLLLGSTLGGYAQSVNPPIVKATITPDSVAIGDQFELEIIVDKDIVQLVDFPQFQDGKLSPEIEIIEEYNIDTLSREGRKVTLSKRFRLTSFDEGIYSVGKIPILFADKNVVDTIWSRDSILLTVATFAIDTTKQTIHDIKLPMDTPLKFAEISGYILGGLLALIIIGLFIYFLMRYRANKPLIGRVKEVLPPHIVAISALVELKNKKVWQSSKHKLYYTSLTDIFRVYLEGRYSIHAMEMTTDEIVSALKELKLSTKCISEIKNMLSTADLVKFAKVVPDGEDNENNYNKVYYFVEDTKYVIELEEKSDEKSK